MRIVPSVVAALVFAAVSVASAVAAPPEKIGLMDLNNSGETGFATLVAKGSKTLVMLQVDGAPHGVAQPAHVHRGSCDHLDPKPAFALNPVVNGRSTTLVNAPLDRLMSGNYSVNVHASAKNIKHYVACGELLR